MALRGQGSTSAVGSGNATAETTYVTARAALPCDEVGVEVVICAATNPLDLRLVVSDVTVGDLSGGPGMAARFTFRVARGGIDGICRLVSKSTSPGDHRVTLIATAYQGGCGC